MSSRAKHNKKVSELCELYRTGYCDYLELTRESKRLRDKLDKDIANVEFILDLAEGAARGG